MKNKFNIIILTKDLYKEDIEMFKSTLPEMTEKEFMEEIRFLTTSNYTLNLILKNNIITPVIPLVHINKNDKLILKLKQVLTAIKDQYPDATTIINIYSKEGNCEELKEKIQNECKFNYTFINDETPLAYSLVNIIAQQYFTIHFQRGQESKLMETEFMNYKTENLNIHYDQGIEELLIPKYNKKAFIMILSDSLMSRLENEKDIIKSYQQLNEKVDGFIYDSASFLLLTPHKLLLKYFKAKYEIYTKFQQYLE